VGQMENTSKLVPPSPAHNVSTEVDSTRLPLYHRAGSVAILDDDPDFVEMLSLSLPRQWGVRSFVSPFECLEELQQEPPKWEADFWAQQEIVGLWRLGAPLVPLVLRYWGSSPDRYKLTKVLVADYLMPGKDGLQTLADLGDWPGQRVLLTGTFDDSLATRAFNDGLIDKFIVKQRPELRNSVMSVVETLLAKPNARHHQIWSATLKKEQAEQLARKSVAEVLNSYVRAAFVEWVVIGDPFGILGLDRHGNATWLQLELLPHLNELAELCESVGMSKAEADEIRAGQKLCNVEMRLALGTRDFQTIRALQVGDEPGLLAAASRIEISAATEDEFSQYRRHLHVRSENQSAF